jgi:hypothetical protein
MGYADVAQLPPKADRVRAIHATLAQLAERLTRNEQVISSILIGGSITHRLFRQGGAIGLAKFCTFVYSYLIRNS